MHILAAETLKQGLAMRDLPPYDAPLVVLALAAMATLASRRFSGMNCSRHACVAFGVEVAALLLQRYGMLRAPTAAIDLSICAFRWSPPWTICACAAVCWPRPRGNVTKRAPC